MLTVRVLTSAAGLVEVAAWSSHVEDSTWSPPVPSLYLLEDTLSFGQLLVFRRSSPVSPHLIPRSHVNQNRDALTRASRGSAKASIIMYNVVEYVNLYPVKLRPDPRLHANALPASGLADLEQPAAAICLLFLLIRGTQCQLNTPNLIFLV